MLVMQFTRLCSLADCDKTDDVCDRMNTLNGYITKQLHYLTHIFINLYQKSKMLKSRDLILPYVPAGFNIKHTKFCPQNVVTCFMWISERQLFSCTSLSGWFYNPD